MAKTAAASPAAAPTVAVIGCGPAGMFFLHAIEMRRQELKQKGDSKGLASLPIATCFDKAPAPGGVWRAEREFETFTEKEEKKVNADTHHLDKDETAPPSISANMYEALWTNGAKENTEFFDYTYDDHFGCRLPVHLPRRAVLDYMMTRVTRNCPNLFQKHAKFNTQVASVKYHETTCKFEVITKSILDGKVTTGYYDKCIWAAGDNGKPKMPQTLLSLFEANFRGHIMHSSDARDLKEAVRGKRVLMIGGSYSAEDLALMSIKLGVEKVYISHRDTEAQVLYTSRWPQDKVVLLSEQIPVQVLSGQTIQFAKVTYNHDTQEYERQSCEVSTELRDIHTVIFCTGYEANMSMLEAKLLPPPKPTEYDNYSIPPEWQMTPNALTPEIGEVLVVANELSYRAIANHSWVQPGLYRDVLISNPSMMFSFGGWAEEPLFGTDICAWKFLAYITGTTPLPCQKEMQRRNNLQFQREFQIPHYRALYDANYRRAVDALDDDEQHWRCDWEDERCKSLGELRYRYPWLVFCIGAKDGHYPVKVGSHDEGTFTRVGEKLYEMNCKSGWLRTLPDATSDEYEWRTFRDPHPQHAECFASIFTGTKAVPLKKRWMDIDEENDVLW